MSEDEEAAAVDARVRRWMAVYLALVLSLGLCLLLSAFLVFWGAA